MPFPGCSREHAHIYEITMFPVWTDTSVKENYSDPAYADPLRMTHDTQF